ncbi:hypothetical protein C1H46_013844 [Malus baccata]|uniref:Peptidase M28 domain-containing protein n=1 Tax=Malus baccata TaxID=106549 RepID=A0A540MQF5_MALBA|nr:hypothetical protein C1H46_013844 [Malus baccata]
MCMNLSLCMGRINCLGPRQDYISTDAPLDRFSEARAVKDVRVLVHEINGRQEGHPGLIKAARISSIYSQDNEPSVLLNGHFDSPLASPGAADCGSCVASMLEIARPMVDSGWVPPRPVIFLFNGAEELFLLVSYFHNI